MLSFLGGGLYASADYKAPGGRFNASAGLRTDEASFSRHTSSFWRQLSPRASLSWMLWQDRSFNISGGLYHQLPPVTALSFRDEEGSLVNMNLSFMRVGSLVGTDRRASSGTYPSIVPAVGMTMEF